VEIIWGTSVDETLTDELRVTVIATGISDGKTHMPRMRPAFRDVSRTSDMARGVVRSKTPEEMKNFDDVMVQPTYIRKKQEAISRKLSPGANVGKFKNDGAEKAEPYVDYDIPTFLRRKAD
jgi:cell division protein FtsZ